MGCCGRCSWLPRTKVASMITAGRGGHGDVGDEEAGSALADSVARPGGQIVDRGGRGQRGVAEERDRLRRAGGRQRLGSTADAVERAAGVSIGFQAARTTQDVPELHCRGDRPVCLSHVSRTFKLSRDPRFEDKFLRLIYSSRAALFLVALEQLDARHKLSGADRRRRRAPGAGVQGSFGGSQPSVLVRLFRKATILSSSASVSPVGLSSGVLPGSGLPPLAM